MKTPSLRDRLAAAIASAEERLTLSDEHAQQIGESLLPAHDVVWRSRRLLTQGRDEQSSNVKRREGRNAGDASKTGSA